MLDTAIKSTHRVEVVPVKVEPIEGADFVGLARVHGYTCVTAKAQWEGRALGAYLPPDSVVDTTRPEFAFLAPLAKANGKHRIKAVKKRGVLSFGLLVPAPPGAKEGDDVAELLGVEHYDPVVHSPAGEKGGLVMGGEVAPAPNVFTVKYDLDAGRRYAKQMFRDGELCLVTEKIHGCLHADTLVTMADSSKKPIGLVGVGDMVMSYNEHYRCFEPKQVTAKIVRREDSRLKWLRITLASGRYLTITSDHFVLTKRGWIAAGDLTTEDDIMAPE